MMNVRSGGYAIYNGERVWVSSVDGEKDMALIVFNSDGDVPAAIRVEWVPHSSLGSVKK